MNDWLYVDKTEYVWKLVNIRFPNIEVDSSFTGSLVARYSSSGNDTQTVIDFARNALKDGSADDFICSERNIREWKEEVLTSENAADYMK